MQREPVIQNRADESMLSSAYRAGLRLNRFGFWLRACCLFVLLGVVLASPGYRLHALWLVPGFVGLALAGLEHEEMYVKLLPDNTWVDVLKHNFADIRDKAAVSLSGVTEAVGMVGAALLVAGPVPIRTSPGAQTIAIIAMLALVWNVLSQTLLDTGWYNRGLPAPRWMIVFRWSAPGLAMFIGVALLWWPTAQSLSLSSAMVGGGSFLLLWPCIGLVDTLHECGRNASALYVGRTFSDALNEHSEVLHNIKNELKSRASSIPDSVENAGVERRITNDLLGYFFLEWRRAAMDSDQVTLDEIWEACLMAERLRRAVTIDGPGVRARLHLVDDTDHCGFEQSAGELIRSLVMDLATNALDAGATKVIVHIHLIPPPAPGGRDEVVVTIEDDGDGQFPHSYPNGSSLATLQGLCAARKGSLTHASHPDHTGTLVTATLRTTIIPSVKPSPTELIQSPHHKRQKEVDATWATLQL